jgi:hypothetical protein
MINPIKLAQAIQKAKQDPSITDDDIMQGIKEKLEEEKQKTTQMKAEGVKESLKPSKLKTVLKTAALPITAPATYVAKTGIGALKGAGSTALGAFELGQAGLNKLGVPKAYEERPEFLKKLTTPQGTLEKIGYGGEQIVEYIVPGMQASKVAPFVKNLKYLSKSPKFIKGLLATLSGAAAEGTTAAGVSSIQQGEINKQSLVTGGVGAAFPLMGGMLKPLLKGIGSAISPSNLMRKAMGITGATYDKIDNIAKQGKYYSDLPDFAFKKGIKGSPDDMIQQVDDLWEKTRTYKGNLFKNVTKTIKNDYKNIFNYLKNEYKGLLGQEDVFKEINILSKKNYLTASELEKVRFLMDETMPLSAYTTKSRPAVKGIEKTTDKLRETLASLDKTGTLKQTNNDIRILYKLMETLPKSANKSVINKLLGRTALRILSLGVPAAASGNMIAKAAALIAGLTGAATDIPIVSSNLAGILQKTQGSGILPLAGQTIKSATTRTLPELTQ